MILAALLPPDHVNRLCYQAQDELFRRYGLVSSRALPPLIPIGWADNDTIPDLTVLRGTRLIPFLLGPVVNRNRWITIDVEPRDSMEQIRHLLKLHTVAPAAAPTFPFDRVLLAAVEERAEREPDGETDRGMRTARDLVYSPDTGILIGTTSGQSMRTVTAALIEIVTADGATWWSAVDWRVLHRRKITAAR